MLSEKPWKLEAIVRLLLSVFVCMCAGSLLVTLMYQPSTKSRLLFLLASAGGLGFLGVTLGLLRKPWTIDNIGRRFATVLVCAYAGMMLLVCVESLAGRAQPVPSTGQMLIGMLGFQGATLVLTHSFLRQQGLTLTEAFGFRNDWRKALLWGVIVAALFLPIGLTIQKLCEIALRHAPGLPFKPNEQLPVQTLRHASLLIHRIVLGAATIVLAPAAEETLFRGILYPAIKQAGFPRLSLWLTSFAFAAMHANAIAFVPLLVLALFLTMLYERTNNLLAPIAAHAVFNGIEFILLYIQERAVS